MNSLKLNGISVAIALALSAGAMAAQTMSKDDYKAAQNSIASDYKLATANCSPLKANAKDVCMAEANGKDRVAKAELDARNNPGDKTHYAVSVAKAETAFAVAKAKCADKPGNEKNACIKDAESVQTRAKDDAKAQLKSADAAKANTGKSAPPGAKKESVGEYVDDAVITTKVKAAVLQEPSLKSAEINVETLKGTVQLSGFVRSRADINKAVEVAKGVNGVKSVKNDMILKGTQ